MNKTSILSLASIALITATVLSSCKDNTKRAAEFAPNMYESLAYDPDMKNPNFADGKTAQLPPAGTTPIGYDRFDYPGTREGFEASKAAVNPLEATEENLAQGKQLYIAMCAPCHGDNGSGNGHIVELGKYPAPPSYATGNSSRGGLLKDLTAGQVYHTIQYGLNLMGSYASQLSPEERWKVVLYVNELQKAQ